MDWLEISIDAHGAPETVCDTLVGIGAEGFVIQDEEDFHSFLENNTQYWDFVDDELEKSFSGTSRVKLWLSDSEESRAMIAQMEKLGLAPDVKQVCDADWENNWRDYYQPVEAGEKLVIVPQWHAYDGNRIPVLLDPGLLFGTGDHPTTKMCLAAVERYVVPGCHVLDLGCGSGILGITAAVLGAAQVMAVDVDEKAPDIVRANASLNGVESAFTIHVGDVVASERLRQRLGKGYSLVLANVVADVIIPLAPFVPEFLASNGVFVCSGIIDGREEEVAEALFKAGLHIEERLQEQEWNCFICTVEEISDED